MKNNYIKFRLIFAALGLILTITMANYNVYAHSYDRIYYQIQQKYDYLSRSIYAITEDYIIATHGISFLNSSIYIYNRTDRSIIETYEIVSNSSTFRPKIIISNEVPNYTKNIFLSVGLNSKIILWNISGKECLKSFSYFKDALYSIKDAYLYKDTIFIVLEDPEGEFFLYILDLNLEIINFHFLDNDDFFNAYLIGKKYLLTILLEAEWNSSISDVLYMYNISSSKDCIHEVCSKENIKWVSLSIKDETIFIAEKSYISFYDLNNFSQFGSYELELNDPLSGFESTGFSIRRVLFHENLLILDVFDTSTIYFFNYTNRSHLSPLGIISGTDLFIIYEYNFIERDTLLISEEYELAFLYFDLKKEKEPVLNNFNIDLQGSLWIIILIIGIALGLLVLSKKKK